MTNTALKLQGPWEVCRKFKIPKLSDPDGAKHVESALNDVVGVRGLAVDLPHHLVQIRYETTETDYEAIRNALSAAGLAPIHGWWSERKARWLQDLDLTSRENAGVRPSPCCSKPPPAARR
jgi:copper chaperone CopZ